jgi:hypothetical protein
MAREDEVKVGWLNTKFVLAVLAILLGDVGIESAGTLLDGVKADNPQAAQVAKQIQDTNWPELYKQVRAEVASEFSAREQALVSRNRELESQLLLTEIEKVTYEHAVANNTAAPAAPTRTFSPRAEPEPDLRLLEVLEAIPVGGSQ